MADINQCCPYKPTIKDEVSGIDVANNMYHAWLLGYCAGMKEAAQLIKQLEARLLLEAKKDD